MRETREKIGKYELAIWKLRSLYLLYKRFILNSQACIYERAQIIQSGERLASRRQSIIQHIPQEGLINTRGRNSRETLYVKSGYEWQTCRKASVPIHGINFFGWRGNRSKDIVEIEYCKGKASCDVRVAIGGHIMPESDFGEVMQTNYVKRADIH